MQQALAALPAAAGLGLRVGIDSAPVVGASSAGAKFGYDVWGDTLNTASRMQSHAAAGAIQVTERTHDRLAESFIFERRLDVAVKGKGEMTTYLLLGERSELSAATSSR